MANNTYLIIFLSVITIHGSVCSSPTDDGCQSTSVQKDGYFIAPVWQMDSPTLKHVTLQKNASGITLFEMYVTVKINNRFDILLKSSADEPKNVYSIVCIKPNSVILYRDWSVVLTANPHGLLSWDDFSQYYIKIQDDWLLFGKRGQLPMLAYADLAIKKLTEFSFSLGTSDVHKPSQIYYDCPKL